MAGPTPKLDPVGREGIAPVQTRAQAGDTADGGTVAGVNADAAGEGGCPALPAGAARQAEARAMTRADLDHLLREQRAYAYDRAGFLELVSRLYALAGIVAGGAVFAELSASGLGKYLLGVAIPVIGAAEIVFNFGKRAERWREIIRLTDALLAQLDGCAEAPPDFIADLQRRYDEVVLPQEPLFHHARAVAWNVAARERGLDDRCAISGWRVWTRNLWPGRPDF